MTLVKTLPERLRETVRPEAVTVGLTKCNDYANCLRAITLQD
ncbi:MAG TPA: hypothetical protein VGM91_02190 [Conexibacter sp.]|jgi:hypothetical protein